MPILGHNYKSLRAQLKQSIHASNKMMISILFKLGACKLWTNRKKLYYIIYKI